ncbi:MAG: hypothetical protein P1U34_11425 [Coxiellaceae bacterium]|nr:hypothetical protein [Coxiellaceae bacterium]
MARNTRENWLQQSVNEDLLTPIKIDQHENGNRVYRGQLNKEATSRFNLDPNVTYFFKEITGAHANKRASLEAAASAFYGLAGGHYGCENTLLNTEDIAVLVSPQLPYLYSLNDPYNESRSIERFETESDLNKLITRRIVEHSKTEHGKSLSHVKAQDTLKISMSPLSWKQLQCKLAVGEVTGTFKRKNKHQELLTNEQIAQCKVFPKANETLSYQMGYDLAIKFFYEDNDQGLENIVLLWSATEGRFVLSPAVDHGMAWARLRGQQQLNVPYPQQDLDDVFSISSANLQLDNFPLLHNATANFPGKWVTDSLAFITTTLTSEQPIDEKQKVQFSDGAKDAFITISMLTPQQIRAAFQIQGVRPEDYDALLNHIARKQDQICDLLNEHGKYSALGSYRTSTDYSAPPASPTIELLPLANTLQACGIFQPKAEHSKGIDLCDHPQDKPPLRQSSFLSNAGAFESKLSR